MAPRRGRTLTSWGQLFGLWDVQAGHARILRGTLLGLRRQNPVTELAQGNPLLGLKRQNPLVEVRRG